MTRTGLTSVSTWPGPPHEKINVVKMPGRPDGMSKARSSNEELLLAPRIPKLDNLSLLICPSLVSWGLAPSFRGEKVQDL